jgi:hypothetical protein
MKEGKIKDDNDDILFCILFPNKTHEKMGNQLKRKQLYQANTSERSMMHIFHTYE